jgi:hypothetical protein
MGHTPGPWFVNDDCIEAGGPEGPRDVTVAMVTGSTNPREANARLLAAAPELLQHLRECFQMLEDYYDAISMDGDDLSGRSWLLLGPSLPRQKGGPMKIDLTDDQYLHLLMALTMALDVLEETVISVRTAGGACRADSYRTVEQTQVSDAMRYYGQQLAVNEDLYRQLVDLKKGVTLVTH